ncbi:GntR family transcriptional regulator [Terasakiella sp. SH-1]|uniref:GntR family transcriptional regulator n=1 Tax=Terasakiella sp. SH-1 TaxID=2560057 RepID=UPI001073370A|nr:GntR family transcriptional regulator [Terasakiella sp. SH-1]
MTAKSKVSRVDNAYDMIKEEILENRMPPGFQATEPEIAVRLGMSRTPVREALLKLEAEGLLEIIPRRGARVLPIMPEDMSEIYQILTALEPEAAYLLASRTINDHDLKELEDLTTKMEKAIQEEDRESWAKADDGFHRKLLELCANKRLEKIISTLFDQAHRARMLTLKLREMPVKSTQEHRELMDAITSGNAEKAKSVFREHRERSAKELVKILDEYRFSNL